MSLQSSAAFVVFSLLSVGWASPPAVAQSSLAAMCVNQCGNACYTKPPGREFSCQQQCMANAANAGPADTHGAIFIGQPPSGAVGWSYRAANSRDAQGLAQQACEQNNDGQPCRELITYTNRCGVAVKAMAGGAIAGVVGSARETAADAQRDATLQCQASFPEASCELEAASCSNQG